MKIIILILLAYACFGFHLSFNFDIKNLTVSIETEQICTFIALILYCISIF